MMHKNHARFVAATGSVIATSALALGALLGIAPTETLGAATRTADFEAKFQAEKKPREVIGQWAESSYSANSPTTGVKSAYSTTPQDTQSRGNACAHGGNGGKCGDNNSRSGASVELPAQGELEWTPSSWKALAAFYFTLDTGATTRVACRPDGSLEAFEPTWGIKYGNGSYFRNRGMQYLRWNDNKTIDSGERFSRLKSGQTFKFTQVSSNSADTKGEITITPRWGTNTQTREAWSELTISVIPFYQDNRSQTGGPWTYTLSSRCGLNMNDGTGSEGPSTTFRTFSAGVPSLSYGAELPDVAAGAALEEGLLQETPTSEQTAQLETVTGLERRDDFEHGSGQFQVEATRDVTSADIQQIHAVLDLSAASAEDQGTVDGNAWVRRQLLGLPTVTLSLPGGGYARVTPKIAMPAAAASTASKEIESRDNAETADAQELNSAFTTTEVEAE